MFPFPPAVRPALPRKLERMIAELNEEQLRLLNHRVVERLKLMHKARDLCSLAHFQPLDRAFFLHENRRIVGTVTRLNRRTVSLVTDDGHHWKVSPMFLTKIVDREAQDAFHHAFHEHH